MKIKNIFQNVVSFIKKHKKPVTISVIVFLIIAVIFIPYIFKSTDNGFDTLFDFHNNEIVKNQGKFDEITENQEKSNKNEEQSENKDELESKNEEKSNDENSENSQSGSSNSNNISSNEATHIPSYPNLPSPVPAQKGNHIVGYYMCWSRYKGFNPEHINASKITHLNYAFANIGSDLSIGMVDSNVDWKNFESLRNIKKSHANLRTLISIGGWDYSKYFSDAAANSTNRSNFAENCLNFILDHGFDGIDIDWEYPVSGGLAGNTNRTEDKQNFTLLLKEIRNKLNEQSTRDGRTYYLTVAADPSTGYLNKIEAKNVASIVDHIFLMGYDYNSPWDHYASFNAPLHYNLNVPSATQGSVSQGINAFLNAGIPASKIVMGVPFYGYQYTVNSTVNNGLGSTFKASGSVPFDDVVSKFLNNASYHYFFDITAKVPYLFGNETFISFDNEQSITEKVNFAKSKGLAGAGAWELSFDKNSKLLGVLHSLLK